MEQPIKVALITGSSSGIGAAAARLFSQRGFKVVVTGSNADRVGKVAQECSDLSPHKEALPLVADLSVLENSEIIVRKTIEHFGRLDVLVNNAGIHFKTHSTDESTFDQYKKIMAVNVDSVVKTTMAAIPHLEKAKGCIVFVSSVSALKPGANAYAYRMSKAALSSYAKNLAVDVGSRVRVNIICPGPVWTNMLSKGNEDDDVLRNRIGAATLLGRVGDDDEVAKTIYFMASSEASFCQGSELVVDGGYVLKPNIVV